MSEAEYVVAWKKDDPQIAADAIAVWNSTNSLPADINPEDRAKELCALAYINGEVAGISTIAIRPYMPLGNRRFGFLRVFTLPRFEQQSIAIGLAITCRDALRQWSIDNPAEKLYGMAAIYQSDKLGHYPIGESGLMLIGYGPNKEQIRVVWFNHLHLKA